MDSSAFSSQKPATTLCVAIAKGSKQPCKKKPLRGHDRCRYHKLCVSTDTATGERCKKWDGLNERFLCENHAKIPSTDSSCISVVGAASLPCSNAAAAAAERYSYCKVIDGPHDYIPCASQPISRPVPATVLCSAIAKGSKQPCKKKPLVGHDRCKYHKLCTRTEPTTGQRCTVGQNLDDQFLCERHSRPKSHQTSFPNSVWCGDDQESIVREYKSSETQFLGPERPAFCCSYRYEEGPDEMCPRKSLDGHDRCSYHKCCKGITKKTGTRCKVWLDLNQDFFCEYHARSMTCPTDPSSFRANNLLLDKGRIVREYRKDKDVYQDSSLPTQYNQMLDFQLDHVLELQVVRDCYDQMRHLGGTGIRKKKEDCLPELKAAVNAACNLNFTTGTINMLKEDGVRRFQNSYLAGIGQNNGLLGCLVEVGPKLTREVSKRIQSTTDQSGNAIIDLLQTDECPVKAAMVEALHSNLVAMKLK